MRVNIKLDSQRKLSSAKIRFKRIQHLITVIHVYVFIIFPKCTRHHRFVVDIMTYTKLKPN